MSKALTSLKEYVERVDNEFLLNEEKLEIEREKLEEWKKQFKQLVMDVVKSIAEYSLFASEGEKNKWSKKTKCLNNGKNLTEEFIKKFFPFVRDHSIEVILYNYFKVYIPEKEEIYEDYLKRPLTELYHSFGFGTVLNDVVFIINDNIANIFEQYKNKLSNSNVSKIIYMHLNVDKKFEEMNNCFCSKEEIQYFLRLKEQNILDLLEKYKEFVEETMVTEQKFINEVVYAQMILKQNFLNEE